jgi:hypothetical protein
MSYFKRDADQSQYLADRLPIYVFPAFVGSGRMLLGMALAAVTTAILVRTGAAAETIFWWLGMFAYLASVVLVVSGIFAVNVIPPKAVHHEAPGAELELKPPGRSGPAAQETARHAPLSATPEERQSHLTVLLVERWGLITKEQLSRALIRQANSGRSLVDELARMGLLTDEKLEHVLALQAAEQDPWHEAPRHG